MPLVTREDRIIKGLNKGIEVISEGDLSRELLALKKRKNKVQKILDHIEKDDELPIVPTDFVSYAFRLPDQNTRKLANFSFEGREYLHRVYNTPNKRTLLRTGRQVEKSTSLGNRILTYCLLISSFKALYVSTSNMQTKAFSNERIKNAFDLSDILRNWIGSELQDNIFEKRFVNNSTLALRSAMHSADRIRGLTADMVAIDEIQDILVEFIPIIEECMTPSPFKYLMLSGTPKTFDNTIEFYWERQSTQGEWVVPCDHCGGGDYRYFNILDAKNMGVKHLICSRCGERIYPEHEDAQWAAMVPEPKVARPFESFRIPQLMIPRIVNSEKEWTVLTSKRETYPPAKFANEVLGLPYDSGARPLTLADIQENCDQGYSMFNMEDILRFRGNDRTGLKFIGVDWGPGESRSYTVMTIGGYVPGDDFFRVFFVKRFIGEEADPDRVASIIERYIRAWKPDLVGTDYGGGWYPNDYLIKKFGPRKVFRFQYTHELKGAKVRFKHELRRFIVNRTDIMSDVFAAIKRRDVFRFPKFEEFYDPFGQDMLNIFSEYNEKLQMNQYQKPVDKTDDAFHSLIYCFLVSTLRHPRPDVFFPKGDERIR